MAGADTTSDTMPIPRRFWWLKQIAVVIVLFGCVLVGLRYASLAVAKWRLEAEIRALKARGEPLEPEDFLDRPASPEEDAGPDLLAAGKMFVVPRQYQTAWNQIWLTPAGIKNTAMIDAVLSANREALAKVRAARGKRVVNWGLPIRSPTEQLRFPIVRQMRELFDALSAAAQKAKLEGNDREAVEYLRDSLMLARSLETQPLLISSFVSTGMQDRVSATISFWSSPLKIDKGENAATEAQVRALIAELLEDGEKARSGTRWTWQGERMMQMHLIRALASEDPTTRSAAMVVNLHGRFLTWWMRPMEVANAKDLLEMSNMQVNAAGAKDLPEAEQIIYEWERRGRRNLQLSKISPMRANLRPYFETVFARREAAVALAARLFEAKYRREPKDADELVPEFLAEVPMDPLRDTKSRLIRLPQRRSTGR